MSEADADVRSERRGGETIRPAEPTPLHVQNHELVPPPATALPPLVLIAEDEKVIAEILADIIEDEGYTPLVAEHGKQAVELMRVQRPALIITDLMMPQMGGLELIQWVRADAHERGYPPPPIILITASRMRMREIMDAGPDAVLGSPFDITVFIAVMHRLLDTSRLS